MEVPPAEEIGTSAVCGLLSAAVFRIQSETNCSTSRDRVGRVRRGGGTPGAEPVYQMRTGVARAPQLWVSCGWVMGRVQPDHSRVQEKEGHSPEASCRIMVPERRPIPPTTSTKVPKILWVHTPVLPES